MTRNIRMPMLPPALDVRRETKSWNASMGLPLVYRKQPTIMPRNKDEYTSLVIKARTMAATGGSKDATMLHVALGKCCCHQDTYKCENDQQELAEPFHTW